MEVMIDYRMIAMRDALYALRNELRTLNAKDDSHDSPSLSASIFHLGRALADLQDAIHAYREAQIYGEVGQD